MAASLVTGTQLMMMMMIIIIIIKIMFSSLELGREVSRSTLSNNCTNKPT